MAVKLQPLADWVVAEQEEAITKTASGLYLPDKAAERPKVAKVLKVGKDVKEIKIGDRTTTVIILTYQILNEANRLIAAGHSPMELRKGLEKAAADVIARLGSASENIGSKKHRVTEVATISAGDPEIGNLIADVMEK